MGFTSFGFGDTYPHIFTGTVMATGPVHVDFTYFLLEFGHDFMYIDGVAYSGPHPMESDYDDYYNWWDTPADFFVPEGEEVEIRMTAYFYNARDTVGITASCSAGPLPPGCTVMAGFSPNGTGFTSPNHPDDYPGHFEGRAIAVGPVTIEFTSFSLAAWSGDVLWVNGTAYTGIMDPDWYYYYDLYADEWADYDYGSDYVYDPYVMCYDCAAYEDCHLYPECEGDWASAALEYWEGYYADALEDIGYEEDPLESYDFCADCHEFGDCDYWGCE